MRATLNGKPCTVFYLLAYSTQADRVRAAARLAGVLELIAAARWQRAAERLHRTGRHGLTPADDLAMAHCCRVSRWLRARYGVGHTAADLHRVEAAVAARCGG